jgi:hypothetical protein
MVSVSGSVKIPFLSKILPKWGDVPLDVENRGTGVAWVDGYAAFDVSSRPKCLA